MSVDTCFRAYQRKGMNSRTNLRNSTCNISTNCFKANSDPFRTKTVIVDENYVSLNNKLVGGQNPKTLIPPVITTPAYSMAWRKSDTIVPNRINDKTNENLYKSGMMAENLHSVPLSIPKSTCDDGSNLNSTSMIKDRLGDRVEHFTHLDVESEHLPEYGMKDWKDKINTANGYDATQFENSAFPANLPRGTREQSSDMADYHRKIFTQTVQPGVYYREDVVEPVNSNIGISFQQQFLPRTREYIKHGEFIDVDHDPNFAPEMVRRPEPPPQRPNIDNVYDPRFNGYGTSSRCYIDNVAGQPRFTYDDVNAVKMPNYITRNKLDTHDFADQYGSVVGAGRNLNDIRPLAQAAFYNDSEQFRNDISISAMRKMNASMWQRRQAPLSASKR